MLSTIQNNIYMDANIQEVLSLYGRGLSKQSSKSYRCLCPECKDSAILSHSLQRKCVLEAIADKYKKVVGIDKGTNTLKSYFTKSVKFKKYGIGEASIFKGFCNKHDTQIFAEIENENFNPKLLKHNLLLFLREVSYQYADRRDIDEVMKYVKQNLSALNKYKARLLSYETDRHEQDYMKLLIEKLYTDITKNRLDDYDFTCYVINKKYELACLTIIDLKLFFPYLRIKNCFDSIFCFSLFPNKNSTIVSFSYLKKYISYMEELLKDNLDSFINKIIFNYSERTFFNPECWNRMDDSLKEYCEKSFVYPFVRDRNYFNPPFILKEFYSK